MATTNIGNQTTRQPQPQPQPRATSTYQSEPKAKSRRIPAVRHFGVFSLITAFVLFCLGIAAIAIKAKDSYVGSSIWTALLFVLPTGALGLLSYWKTNTCSKAAYFVMNLLSCLMCAHLVIHAGINAAREVRWYDEWICEPQPGYHHFFYNYEDDYDYSNYSWPWRHDREIDYEGLVCPFSPQSRVAVDLTIMIVALIHFVVSVVSMAFACYGMCWCCYRCCSGCCRGAPPPAMVQYTAQNGTCQLVSAGGYQAPSGFQQVSLMVPAAQLAQPGQVTSPPTFHVVPGQLQPQTAVIPNSQNQMTVLPPNQMVMPQNQMTVLPPNQLVMPQNQMTVLPPNQMVTPQNQMMVMPQNQMTAMPPNQMMVIPPNQSAVNPPQVSPPSATYPPTLGQTSNSVNGLVDETGQEPRDMNGMAYGNTATEHFHDKRNLLESV